MASINPEIGSLLNAICWGAPCSRQLSILPSCECNHKASRYPTSGTKVLFPTKSLVAGQPPENERRVKQFTKLCNASPGLQEDFPFSRKKVIADEVLAQTEVEPGTEVENRV